MIACPKSRSSSASHKVLAGLAFLLATAFSAGAAAQDGLQLDVQTFRPAVGPYSIYTVETSPTLGHLEPTGSVFLNYSSEPLVLEPDAGGENVAIIDQQLAMHVLAGVGFFDIAQLDLEVPIYFVNDSEFSDNVEGGVIGDMALRPKVMILSREKFPVGVTGLVDVTLPTGRQESLVGDSSVEVAPGAVVDYRWENVLVAANLGVRIQEDRSVRNIEIGERFEYGLGAEAEFLNGLLLVGGELYGRTEFGDFFGDDVTPLEGLLGAKVVTRSGFSVMAGAGGGIVGGVGAPEFRGFLGLRYAYMETDSDQDGVRDVEDKCRGEAEDIDGFEDADGCPDPDNDEDGVADIEDQCPQTPGPADNNGCPVEGEEAPKGEEGAEADKAGETSMPTEPPSARGPDADNDGVVDANDLCPEQPEDEDGFEDKDGCPDTDNDKDGILDADDKCPNEPGLQTTDGCPPEEQKAVLDGDRIKLTEKVVFEADKAIIDKDSYDLLQQVGLIIRTNPDIKKVEIGAHTDQENMSEEEHQILAEARAEAIQTFLVEGANVPAERLAAKGYGDTEPIIASELPQARAQNRRVEFKVLERAGGEASERTE
ncbi:OmpA family protein [Persicimonas caeni]|nr:OmpA family protein [Persicimonas caeni]